MWAGLMALVALAAVAVGAFLAFGQPRGEAEPMRQMGEFDPNRKTPYTEGMLVRVGSSVWVVKHGVSTNEAPVVGTQWELLSHDAIARGMLGTDNAFPTLDETSTEQQTVSFQSAGYIPTVVATALEADMLVQVSGVTETSAEFTFTAPEAKSTFRKTWTESSNSPGTSCFRLVKRTSETTSSSVPAITWAEGKNLFYAEAKDPQGAEWNAGTAVFTSDNDILSVSFTQNAAGSVVVAWVEKGANNVVSVSYLNSTFTFDDVYSVTVGQYDAPRYAPGGMNPMDVMYDEDNGTIIIGYLDSAGSVTRMTLDSNLVPFNFWKSIQGYDRPELSGEVNQLRFMKVGSNVGSTSASEVGLIASVAHAAEENGQAITFMTAHSFFPAPASSNAGNRLNDVSLVAWGTQIESLSIAVRQQSLFIIAYAPSGNNVTAQVDVAFDESGNVVGAEPVTIPALAAAPSVATYMGMFEMAARGPDLNAQEYIHCVLPVHGDMESNDDTESIEYYNLQPRSTKITWVAL
jgi:hypothetical protein